MHMTVVQWMDCILICIQMSVLDYFLSVCLCVSGYFYLYLSLAIFLYIHFLCFSPHPPVQYKWVCISVTALLMKIIRRWHLMWSDKCELHKKSGERNGRHMRSTIYRQILCPENLTITVNRDFSNGFCFSFWDQSQLKDKYIIVLSYLLQYNQDIY